MNINKVAVIGAGVMGASIAAHISNAGVPVILLDIVPKDAKNRNMIADMAVKKLLGMQPAPFMHKGNVRLISTGNIEDDLSSLAEVDWVIEAVIEDLAIKQSLYEKLDKICSQETLISSNTSTLPLQLLSHGLNTGFQQRFMITHFFNPPRYMRLLEIIAGPNIRSDLVSDVRQFADQHLGKGCVMAKDTPGFIGNRIGIYWLQWAMIEAINRGLTVEQADTVLGVPFGIPKTGVFGLLDLVGLDLMPDIMTSMNHALAAEDDYHAISQIPEIVTKMIADGYTGRKGKGGFYRLNTEAGLRIKESINLQTFGYQASNKPKLESIDAFKNGGLQGLFEHDDKVAQYAWSVMSKTLAYAASLIPEISDDLVAVDNAMKWGYSWQYGPFELIDRIGVFWFVERLQNDKQVIPTLLQSQKALYQVHAKQLQHLDLEGHYQPINRAKGDLLLADYKRQKPAILNNPSASLWDVGDGITCLEFHSKMNTLDVDSLAMINQSIQVVNRDFSALVIHNEADNFSVGANLNLLVMAIHQQAWDQVSTLIKQGQQTYKALKYAPFPVVAAPTGLAMGGGCEILLHCDAIQAYAELYTGLVEVGVGLIPGWGGCKEYLARCLQQPKQYGGPMPPVIQAFQTIAMAKVSTSAAMAKDLMFLSKDDGINMNKSRLLSDAKHRALALLANYRPPEEVSYKLPGKTAKTVMSIGLKGLHLLGKVSDYDVHVGTNLAHILSGGDADMSEPLSEDDMLNLELQTFICLVKQAGTLARLEHMLNTGKPLRN